MLVISRKVGESIQFIHNGQRFSIDVRRIAGSRVHLAIDAPRDVQVVRGELPLRPEQQEARP